MTDGQTPIRPADRLLLNAESVARILDVPKSTVYRMIADGRIPSVQIDGSIKRLVPQSSLHAWVRALVKREAEQSGPLG